MNRTLRQIMVAGILLAPITGITQWTLAKIFSDHMVLQRDQPIRIWGKGMPGKTVTAEFAKQKVEVLITADSTWLVVFGKQKANTIPQSLLVVCGDEQVVLRNLLIGDLWLCIGQSNMQWPLQQEMHFINERAQAHQPLLRFYNPAYAGEGVYNRAFSDSIINKMNPGSFYTGQWEESDSITFKTMSAVAWYFGKSVLKETGVPVGLIDLSIGGAPLESFVHRETLLNSGELATKVSGNWLMNDALPVWVRERGRQNLDGLKNINSDPHGPNHPFKPGFAFECGILPLAQLPVKGILCYQGESNAQEQPRVQEYNALFKLLVNDYRRHWQNATLPFYWVQLSSIDTVRYKGQWWPEFRNEQRQLLTDIKYGGMAVTSDVGSRNDVHPTNKKVVGERLARWALHDVYKLDIIPSGPLPERVVYKRNKIVVRFRFTGNGLHTADGGPLRGFSTDGASDTNAFIKGKAVHIPVKSKPTEVYYGWKPFTDANLVNADQLPASTFKWSLKD